MPSWQSHTHTHTLRLISGSSYTHTHTQSHISYSIQAQNRNTSSIVGESPLTRIAMLHISYGTRYASVCACVYCVCVMCVRVRFAPAHTHTRTSITHTINALLAQEFFNRFRWRFRLFFVRSFGSCVCQSVCVPECVCARVCVSMNECFELLLH